MAAVHPFRALRPTPSMAAQVAAVPYDVVSTDEARALAGGNPVSFLRVSRPEIELPSTVDPYSDVVYQRAAQNFAKLKDTSLVLEGEPGIYFYRLMQGGHAQTGVAACFSLDEYDRGVIKKHERTRRDKEDDRTRHMMELCAQTGPVFLTYRASNAIDTLARQACAGEPLFDFEASDDVRHTVWRVGGALRDEVVTAFAQVPALYIADGHHRAASAARTRHEWRRRGVKGTALGDGADVDTLLAVAFPHDQVRIVAYNRAVKDLAGRNSEAFMREVQRAFHVAPGPARPSRRGEIAMYFDRRWNTLTARAPTDGSDPIRALDVSVLQDALLAPILKIEDVRTDTRIEFIGGSRGTEALERVVDSGKAAVAFSLYPVNVTDLMAVSDAGGIMPPKSTWFEPKLRDGLLIHMI
jgi:uncharacterized protein (DUF1015 family)